MKNKQIYVDLVGICILKKACGGGGGGGGGGGLWQANSA